jgi:hypothetical protein
MRCHSVMGEVRSSWIFMSILVALSPTVTSAASAQATRAPNTYRQASPIHALVTRR